MFNISASIWPKTGFILHKSKTRLKKQTNKLKTYLFIDLLRNIIQAIYLWEAKLCEFLGLLVHLKEKLE